jgi:hippurate hydrolase
MRVNFRCFSEGAARTIEDELRRICQHTGEAFGVAAALRQPAGEVPYPATVNHPAETELALAAMRAVAGEDKVRDDLRPVSGSEDFSFILRRVPGAYIFIGNGDSAPVHNPAYDFNDAALPYGVAYFVELVVRALPL